MPFPNTKGRPVGSRNKPKRAVVKHKDDEDLIPAPSLIMSIGDEAVNPLIIIGEETLAQLSDDQQRFLLARIVCTSDSRAAASVGLSISTLSNWKNDNPEFIAAYKIVTTDPVSFALTLNRSIVAKAAVEHMSLLAHPNARVRQWAIELAYKNQNMGTDRNIKVSGEVQHTFDQLRAMAQATPIVIAAPEEEDDALEATFTELGTTEDEGRVD